MRVLVAIYFVVIGFYLHAQSGLRFLNLPAGAHTAAVGGEMVADLNKDLSASYQNPAMLDSVIESSYYFMYSPYLADINRFYFGYALKQNQNIDIAIHVNYLGLGEFDQTDEIGNVIGSFNANQYSLTTSLSSTVGPFSLGTNIKFASSNISFSNRYGILMDLGGGYRVPGASMVIGMVIKNLGYEFGGATNAMFTSDLFDVQIGTTFKPQYMPFRFSITASGLNKFEEPFSIDDEGPDTADRILNYFNIGTSLVLSRAIEFTIGYNHELREQLRIVSGAFGSGFSYGLIVRVKEFEVHFTRVDYGAGGGVSYFAIQNNFNSLKKIF